MQRFLLLLVFSLSSNAFAINPINLRPTGGDDTTNINNAISSLSGDHQSIVLDAGTFNVSAALLTPAYSTSITVRAGAKAIINYTGSGPMLTINKRDTRIANLRIVGTGTANQDGILIQETSWVALDNVAFVALDTALEFQYAHDFRSLRGLAFFNNETDFTVNPSAVNPSNKPSTSFAFVDCRMEKSERSIDINAGVTNFAFINCGFAPEPTTETRPISIEGAAYQGAFQGNRFETKNGVLRDSLYVKGFDDNYPAQSIHFHDNYFTGSQVENHIFIDNFAEGFVFDNNHFQSLPTECDIQFQASNVVAIGNNYALKSRTNNAVLTGNSGSACQP